MATGRRTSTTGLGRASTVEGIIIDAVHHPPPGPGAPASNGHMWAKVRWRLGSIFEHWGKRCGARLTASGKAANVCEASQHAGPATASLMVCMYSVR
eukprot:2904478-Prymnesium_polylepis.1